jgi:hypothetical protein
MVKEAIEDWRRKQQVWSMSPFSSSISVLGSASASSAMEEHIILE